MRVDGEEQVMLGERNNGKAQPENGDAAEEPIQLSETAKQQIQELLEPGEELRVGAEADMVLPGSFGVSWLVGTDRRVCVFVPNGRGPVLKANLPLGNTMSIQRRDGLGSSLLEAHTVEGNIPLVRYTDARCDQMEATQEALQALLPDPQSEEEEEDGPSPEAVEQERRKKAAPCPKCGNPMPRWMTLCPDCVDKRQLLVRLIHRAKQYWKPITVTFLLTAFLRFCAIYPAKLQQQLVDDALELKVRAPQIINAHLNLLWQIIAILAVIRIAASIVGAIQQFIMTWLGEKVTHDLRIDIYNHLQKLGVNYYDQKETGWIMDRVTGDTSTLQSFMTDTLQRTVVNTVTLLVIAALMFSAHPLLAFLALVPAPIVCLMSAGFMKKTHKIWHWAWRRRSRMFAQLSNVLPGVRVVKAFVQENREFERFQNQSEEYMDARVDAARAFAGFSRTTNFIMSLSTLAIWGYGGYLVVQNPTGEPRDGVTVGILVMFMSLVAQFYSPLQELTSMSQQVQQAATSGQRVFEVLDTTPDMEDKPDATELQEIEGKVEFRNVTFGYDERRPVLKNVSFTINPGEMVGLVGPSGAGKSTTINLICRFYDATGGAVLIDEHDVRDVTLSSLRNQIGIVLQEPFLFHGTIAENIAYGCPDAKMEEIIRAAKAANAHDFVMRFPDGYDTLVGERGTRLSGGERQRISIARAILKNPRILILDEATSSVDTETEALIQEAIDRLVHGRTTFAIAHRLSTLQHANRLLVLEKGKLVECGTHKELLSREGGTYRRLVDVQQQLAEMVGIGG
jgi:ATP-binding cassette, subfamily B, bacterial